MKAVAVVLVLVNYFTSCHGLTCKAAPQQLSAAQVDAGHGIVVMTDILYNSFFLTGSSWSKLGSVPLKHVSVGPAGIWGVNKDDKVHKFSGGDFFPVLGLELKQLDAGGQGHVVGVTDTDKIYCLNADRAFSIQKEGILTWDQLQGRLRYFSCGPNGCWGVNSIQHIYFTKVLPNTCEISGFIRINGLGVKIEVGTDGRVFILNQSGQLYERAGISDKVPQGTEWKEIAFQEPLKHASYDLGHLWLVTKCGVILECTD
ncbi:PREDICTED: fish-egg lectin-like [Cyprinodon variegatus]|uniref:fish-egg lectin-like n=1 Tax=Cyprinodon variegatus TaxID=28743 RepID=UPI0007428472|nr:PREDICTED: fish-egg lectin-like [Cyprinodon variegatus]